VKAQVQVQGAGMHFMQAAFKGIATMPWPVLSSRLELQLRRLLQAACPRGPHHSANAATR